MRKFAIFIGVAIISGFVGYAFRSTDIRNLESLTLEAQQYRALKERFEQLGQVDVEEYLKLKSDKARFEKADEILGKVLMLMLYDLGIRGSERQIGRLKERMSDRSSDTKLSGPNAGQGQQPDPDPNIEPVATRTKPAVGQTVGSVRKLEESPKSEKVKEIYRTDQLEDFLKSAEIPDFFGALRSGANLNEAQLEQLNGSFSGRAVFEDPKLVPWDVQMYLNAQKQDNEIFGEFDIRLRKNGKQFSRSKSGRKRGQKSAIKLDNFMGIAGDDQGLIINAYGDDGYFQLYYFPRLNEFHGLVYLKKSLGVFERKGVVRLNKI